MFQGVTDFFKKPDPKELVRKWQTSLRAEQRKIERQIRGRVAVPVQQRCALLAGWLAGCPIWTRFSACN